MPDLGHAVFTRECLDGGKAKQRQGNPVREFVPFDDRWFDEKLPGALVPLPGYLACVHGDGGVFHWVAVDGRPEKPIRSPSRAPIFAAMPALSSST